MTTVRILSDFSHMPTLVRFRELLPCYVHGEDILVAFDYADGLVIPSWQTPIDGSAFQFAFVSHAFNAVLGASSIFRVDVSENRNFAYPPFVNLPPAPMNFYENPLAFEQESFTGRRYQCYQQFTSPLTTPKLSRQQQAVNADFGQKTNCFYTPFLEDMTSFVHLESDISQDRQRNKDVWKIINRNATYGQEGSESDGQAIPLGLKKSSVSECVATDGSFHHQNTTDNLSSRAYQRSFSNGGGHSRRDLNDTTPKDPHSVHDYHSDSFPEDNCKQSSPKEDSQTIGGRYAQMFNNQKGAQQHLSEFSSTTRRATADEDAHQARLKLMEKEQLHFMRRIDELALLLSQKQSEAEHFRILIQRLNDEKLMLINDFKRLEVHNADVCKEYQRQRLHIHDLYFTLSLYGFDYVVLPDGRKIETFREPSAALLTFEQKRRWSTCHNDNIREQIAPFDCDRDKELQAALPVAAAIDQHHVDKTNVTQSCEHLVRKLADLQQQRDHIDGYIDWLRAEARKKEHIYDDPFTDDAQHTDDDLLDHPEKDREKNKSHYSQRRVSDHVSTREIQPNAPIPNTAPPRHVVAPASKHAPNQNERFDGPMNFNQIKNANAHNSPNSPSPVHANPGQRRSVPNANASPSYDPDRKESLATARSRFLRKDSLLSMLLDTSTWSKQRKSLFSNSKQKSKHNAFVSGRGYSVHAGDFGGANSSPAPVRKIRTHII